MATCLGISKENNLIKYAKVSAEKESYKVLSYGIKFSENDETALNEILEETDSHNIPICMNLTGEMYNIFSVFRMLKPKDRESVLNSEFELLCEEKKYSYNTLDSRYLLVEDHVDKDKHRVVYVSAEKAELTSKMQSLQKFRIGNLVPVPIALTHLLEEQMENYAVVNIEEKTAITIIVNNEISNVELIDLGMSDIFEKINEKENSFQKAYEICKNTVIYTMETNESQLVENAYLKDIMPVLYKIVTAVKQRIENELVTMRKIYLTGSAALINNIELYFQEYMPGYKCEVLAPYFIDKYSKKINVKDCIEVNSAIAVAMQGLNDKYKDVNFKNTYLKAGSVMKKNIALPKFGELKEKISFGNVSAPSVNLRGPLRRSELYLIRGAAAGVMAIAVFSAGSIYLKNEIDSKISETEEVIGHTNNEIRKVQGYVSEVDKKSLEYEKRITRLEELTNQVEENNRYVKAIPILLNRIMSVIPKEVKLTSLENTVDGKIIINAEAKNYEDLGYFKATLKTKGILKNVSSDSSVKLENIVKVTIEGELP